METPKMKVLFLLVLLSASLALDLDREPRKGNLVTKELGPFLDEIGQKLSKGVSTPLLDLGEAGNFSDVEWVASGLSKDLDGVKNHGFRLRINISEEVVCGKYHAVHLDLPGLFPVYGKGNFCIELHDVSINVTLEATKNYDTEKFDFNLKEFGMKMQSSKVKFENLMDDPHVADFLNELLSNLFPDLMSMLAELLKTKALPALLDKYGNAVFDCVKAADVKQCIKDIFVKKELPFLEWPPTFLA